MNVPFNADVICTDGSCGKTTKVIIDREHAHAASNR